MLKVISTAALLSLSVFVNANASTHVQSSSVAQLQAVEMLMLSNEPGIDPNIEKQIIELHASPHWGLSTEDAWEAYFSGQLLITEIEEGHIYQVEYVGGLLEIVFEDR